MSNFKLSFTEFVDTDKLMTNIFGSAIGTKMLLEMAKGQQNISKMDVFMDQEDLKFLHQFPTTGPAPWYDNIWLMALMWRYSEGLLRVAEYWGLDPKYGGAGGTDQNPDVDMSGYYKYMAKDKKEAAENTEDVDLIAWEGTKKKVEGEDVQNKLRIYHFKNIKTGSVELWEKLQDPNNQDLDLTDAIRSAQDIRDAGHQFNSTVASMQYETAKRILKSWLLANNVELFGQVKDWQGQPVQGKKPVAFGQSQSEFNLPVVTIKLPSYTITIVNPKGGKGAIGKGGPKFKAGQTITVGNGTYELPVLAPASHLTAITKNKTEILLKLLGLPEDTTKAKLVSMPLFDPSSNRTRESIMKAIDAGRAELDVNDVLYGKIDAFLREAETAYGKIYGSNSPEAPEAPEALPQIEGQPKKKGRPANSERGLTKLQKEQEKLQDLANLNLGNLMMTLDPKYVERSWRTPAILSDSGKQYTGKRDIVSMLLNYDHLSDIEKATLKKQVPLSVVKAQRSGTYKPEDEDEEEPGIISAIGGFSPAKVSFPKVSEKEFQSKFSKAQQLKLIQNHIKAADEIITRAKLSGKLGPYDLTDSQIATLESEREDIRNAVAYRAIYSPRVSRAESSPGVPMDAEEISQKVVDRNMLRSLIISAVGLAGKPALRPGSTSKAIGGSESEFDSPEEGEMGSLLAAGSPASSQGGKKRGRQLARAQTGATPGAIHRTGIEKIYDANKAELTRYELSQRFDVVDHVWKSLLSSHLKDGKSQDVAEMLAKKQFRAALEVALKMSLNASKTGISGEEALYKLYREIGETLAKGKTISRPKIKFDPVLDAGAELGEEKPEELPKTLQAVADTSTYSAGAKKAEISVYDDLSKLEKELKFAFAGIEEEINFNKLISTMFFDDEMSEEEVESKVAGLLHSIKKYFEQSGLDKVFFSAKWQVIINKISKIIRESADLAKEDEEEDGAEKEIPPQTKPEAPAKLAEPAKPEAPKVAPSTSDTVTDEDKKYYDLVDKVYKLAASNSPQFIQIAKSPKNAENLIKIKNSSLIKKFSDLSGKIDFILGKIKEIAPTSIKMEIIKNEMSLPIGYPPYGNKIRKYLGNDANAWGVPNNSTGVGPTEGPIIKKKKKTLKEYLEEKKFDPYRKKLEERIQRGKK